jgi:hypothetical protein
MERLDRDADALSEHYAGMVPETLDSLTSKEHHGINNMLQPRVVVSADGPLEITDVFGRPLEACALRPVKTEGVSFTNPQFHRTPELGFRALLTEGATWLRQERRLRHACPIACPIHCIVCTDRLS